MRELNQGSGVGGTRLSPLLHPDEAPAIPRTMRMCPLCRELMDGEDWRRLPRHETAGKFGITIKLACPECHQQSLSTQWQELRRRQGVVL